MFFLIKSFDLDGMKKSAAGNLWFSGSTLGRIVSNGGQTTDTAFSIGVLSARV